MEYLYLDILVSEDTVIYYSEECFEDGDLSI